MPPSNHEQLLTGFQTRGVKLSGSLAAVAACHTLLQNLLCCCSTPWDQPHLNVTSCWVGCQTDSNHVLFVINSSSSSSNPPPKQSIPRPSPHTHPCTQSAAATAETADWTPAVAVTAAAAAAVAVVAVAAAVAVAAVQPVLSMR